MKAPFWKAFQPTLPQQTTNLPLDRIRDNFVAKDAHNVISAFIVTPGWDSTNSFIRSLQGTINDPNTIFVLNFNGTIGDTSVVDSGPRNLTIEVTGSSDLSATQVKFGVTSRHFKGNSNGRTRYLSTPQLVLTGDFAFGAWVYWSNNPVTTSYAFGPRISNSAGLFRDPFAATVHALTWRTHSGVETSGSTAITNNVWHYLCAQREGGIIRFGLDGVLQGTVADNATYSLEGEYVYIGAAQDGGGTLGTTGLTDYMDDAVLVKNMALWDFPFTPPTEEMTTPGGTSSTPDSYYWFRGTGNDTQWIRADVNYTNAPSVIKMAYYYSNNNEASYQPMYDDNGNYVITINYDSAGNLTTTEWGIDIASYWYVAEDNASLLLLETGTDYILLGA